MTADWEIRDIETGISEVISTWAIKAFKLGCTGIYIRFSLSGTPFVECYFPGSRDNSGEVGKPTFAELMDDAARLTIAAKKMLVDTSLSDKDLAAYANLADQLDALEQWIKDACEKEEEQSAGIDPKTNEDEEGQPVDFDSEKTKE